MISFVTSGRHGYTHAAVEAEMSGLVNFVTYKGLLSAKSFQKATYIFTDMDRLSPFLLGHAAMLFRRLREGGMKVLNDPARIRSRWGLLRALHDRGFNRSNAHRLDENLRPQRWPVFLGVEGDHHFPIPGLMNSWEEVEQAAENAMRDGVPRSNLIVVEYNAEPLRPGVFRKLSVFRVGSRYIGHTCVHEDNWIAKYGTEGLATQDLYEDEARIVRDNPYAGELERAFEIAGIEYGRADFGIVQGAVHLYEINTNPEVKFSRKDLPPLRNESYDLFRRNYIAALRELDS